MRGVNKVKLLDIVLRRYGRCGPHGLYGCCGRCGRYGRYGRYGMNPLSIRQNVCGMMYVCVFRIDTSEFCRLTSVHVYSLYTDSPYMHLCSLYPEFTELIFV